MIKKTTLKEVVEQQRTKQNREDCGLKRSLLNEVNQQIPQFALIISGIRRCGKSTLLRQMIEQLPDHYFFLNFDTAKLYTFDSSHFELLDEMISETNCRLLFFDEIQVVDGWELYVRQKLDEGYNVVITGSNASLLSKELGTKLTGRHITKELFPFSYREFCAFMALETNAASLMRYMEMGGFPAFLKEKNIDLHSALLDDILYRDVAVRHNIRDVQSLKHLLLFLATNIGNLISATKIKQLIGIKSTATILEYLGYFEKSYLIQLIPRFSYSYKVQIVNPRKIYFIDSGLQNAITASFNKDNGRRLENIVFWELRRQQKDVYYYNEKGHECDFIVSKNNQIEKLIQVCYDLNFDNQDREINGLIDAMEFFQLEEGTILTFNRYDTIIKNGKRIEVIPVYSYFK
jgi:uncharacterized protein